MKILSKLTIITLLFITGCSTTTYKTISADDAKDKMTTSENVVLLDVRTPKEYEEKHIQGSILIPDYDIENEIETQISNKDTTIIVYCRSGNRSRNVAHKLTSMGYKDVYDLGGISNYPYIEDIVTN
ncbi:rhodanese-like domain-containing protein [Anaerorhabdus sp.]|jgi:phage shock protein E|uniref:rhodanese-like domain-containing protein n=1 Tax=Anaerorhabdus sp. TaxID=1872524 RepID=UPI002FCBDE69